MTHSFNYCSLLYFGQQQYYLKKKSTNIQQFIFKVTLLLKYHSTATFTILSSTEYTALGTNASKKQN